MSAKERGVKTLALTDHDNIDGIEEARLAAGDEVQIVPGIEFSSVCEYGNFGQTKGIHIVGLNVDLASSILQDAVKHQVSVRQIRAQAIAGRLEKKLGINHVFDGASRYARGAIIGRPHFAQYLVDNGHVNTIAEAFKKYLGAGKVGDVKQCWPNVETVVQWIVQSDGIAVLAHPAKYELTRRKLYHLLECFTTAGGQAMEVVSGKQNKTVTDTLQRAAQDFSLYASFGSDFHAPDKPWQSLGEYSPVPENCQPVWQLF